MLKILADECIHKDLILAVKKRGFGIISTKEAGLTGASDEDIFDFALKSKRVLLSYDREFGDIFRFNISRSAGIIIVLIGQMSKEEVIKAVLAFLAFIKQSEIAGKLAIIGKDRIRIIKR